MFVPNWGPHAIQAARRHGITEQQIANAFVYGFPEPTREYCWKLIGEEVTLVLNAGGDFIVTMYPNHYRDRHIAKSVAFNRRIGYVRGRLRFEEAQWHIEKHEE